jgi:Domain of unknown function (DUF4112)
MTNIFQGAWPDTSYTKPESRRDALARLDRLARLFDTAFLVPGTRIRFGIESIMRLVPGIGDAAASALSCYLLYEAHRLGVPPRIFARMLLNVALEGTVGTVPFLGDAFDVAFRANRRNVALLRDHFESVGWV